MSAFGFDFDQGDVIHVKRDSRMHSWMLAVGGHWVPLPWKDTADAVSVVLWIKEQTGSRIPVSIELES